MSHTPTLLGSGLRMRRRDLLLYSGILVATAASRAGCAQTGTSKPRRIGTMGNFSPSVPIVAPLWAAFIEGLRERGWVDGQNLVIEARWTEGKSERFAEFMDEFINLGDVEVIVCLAGSQATEVAKSKTATIPIVMVGVADPVGAGFIASLARPGGNITGVSNQFDEVNRMQWALLRDIVPGGLQRLGVIWEPANPGSRLGFQDLQRASASLGWTVVSVPLDGEVGVERVFETIAQQRPQGLWVHAVPFATRWRREIASFAITERLPTVTPFPSLVREGLLLSYGPDLATSLRQSAGYVDRLLRGAKAAEIPVEQPTRFQLVINLKTARAIGLDVSQSLLLRADEIIE